MELAGFVGLGGVVAVAAPRRCCAGLVPAATVLLLVSLAVMGRAANLGGEIRHPEIRADGAGGA